MQSGQLLLLCTGRTQESARLDVYFRVITDGIMPTTNTSPGNEWQQRVPGSAEYVLNPNNADLTTSASRYNLVNVDISNNGIITQNSPGDYRVADADDIYDTLAAGTPEDRRHILNELEGISGIPNSMVTATRDGVTWYSEGRGYTGVNSLQATTNAISADGGFFYIEVVDLDQAISFTNGQMIMFTVGAGQDLPAGINNDTTYTAFADTTDPAFNDNNAYFIKLDDVIADGTSDVITPVENDFDAVGVVLQAYHAQLNEEFILDPLDLIDSADELTAVQKEEFRDAARINFESRSGLTRVTTADNSNICLLYTSPSPRDRQKSRMPSSA